MTNQENFTEEEYKKLLAVIESQLRPGLIDDLSLELHYVNSCRNRFFPRNVFDPHRSIVEFVFLVHLMRIGEQKVDLEFLLQCLGELKMDLLRVCDKNSKLLSGFRIFEHTYSNSMFTRIHIFLHLTFLSEELPHIQLYHLALAAMWFHRQFAIKGE